MCIHIIYYITCENSIIYYTIYNYTIVKDYIQINLNLKCIYSTGSGVHQWRMRRNRSFTYHPLALIFSSSLHYQNPGFSLCQNNNTQQNPVFSKYLTNLT